MRTTKGEESALATSERYRKMFPVTWDQLHRDAKALAWRLLEHRNFKSIVVVTKGGLVPAAIIARELNIRMIDTVCIVSYQWQDQEEAGNETILKSIEGDGQDMLVIDDLVDTGHTARIVREMLPKAHFAALYAKPAGRPQVDTFITEVSQDTWILFPWDSEVQYTKPLVDRKNGE